MIDNLTEKPASASQQPFAKGTCSKMLYNAGPRPFRLLSGLGLKPLEHLLVWPMGLVLACGILINTEIRTGLTTATLHIAVLLMAINLLSISAVIVVALFCMLVLTTMCLYQVGFQRWETTTDLLHSLAVLAAIVYLALRSKRACDDLRHKEVARVGITAHKQAEEALYRAQTQLAHVTRVTTLGELAASIAHEVSQPLAAITSSADACRNWLNRAQPDLHEVRQSLDRIVASSSRASEITLRVRALSRKCDPLRQNESLNDIVSETLSLMRYELAHHKINPKIELNAFGGQVNADRVQLQQVIINLIINACQAMEEVSPSQRTLSIRSWLKNNEVLLEVADQGPGIPAGVLSQLFTPFFTTKANGLGMGLSICRSIIDFHEGRIWATSTYGQGSSFVFALPIRGANDHGFAAAI